MAEEVRTLKSRRAILKGQLTKFCTFVREAEADRSKVGQLQARLEKLETVSNSFDEVQTEIELKENSENERNERDEFDDKYFDIITKARSLLANKADQKQKIDVVLPTIKIPEFSGSYESWYSFYDTFKTLIHNNTNLSNIQKYQYLKTALRGEALQVINNIDISDTNYTTAFHLLESRYNNKKFIIKAHVKAIFDLPQISANFSLRKFYDTFQTHFRSLKNLRLPVEQWDVILLYLLNQKLDMQSKREWEIYSNEEEMPRVDDFLDFLNKRCLLIEAMDLKVNSSSQNKPPSGSNNKPSAPKFTHAAVNVNNCSFCNEGSHPLYYCKKLLALNIEGRIAEVKKLKVCMNCLKPGHYNYNCRAENGCRICRQKHNSILHMQKANDDNGNSTTANTTSTSGNSGLSQPQMQNVAQNLENLNINKEISNSVLNHCSQVPNQVFLLGTAVVNIFNSNGKPVEARCLLDSGSTSNLLTEDLFNSLGLRYKNINTPIIGINGKTTNISKLTRAKLQSINTNYSSDLDFLIIDKITEHIPQVSFPKGSLEIPHDIKLADPNYCHGSEINALLGVEIFYDLICSGQIKLGKRLPILQNTKLGWLVSGPMQLKNISVKPQCNFLVNNTIDIQNQIEQFWILEQGISNKVFSNEEKKCEEHFLQTHSRDPISGRFSVFLPKKENFDMLGQSREMATNRFYALERKLSKNLNLKKQYTDFIEEYINLGHMTKLTSLDEINSDKNYYLPHHCVVNHGSSTTPARVVFDGSSKTSSGFSLNEVLRVGPCIQDELFSIIIRARKHTILITADICKMYRQVLVSKPDRTYQRILWRSDPSEPLQHYELKTVTYGTGPASFLATRALQETAHKNKIEFPEASRVILEDFYVDDLITGASDIDSAKSLIQGIDHILKTGCFELRKWSTNQSIIFSDMSQNTNLPNYIISDEKTNKTLGVIWDPKLDSFKYISREIAQTNIVTKRQMLSYIAQIFDPLGLLGPIIINAKIIMQRLWLEKLEWDDPIPENLVTAWKHFISELPLINNFVIPRRIIIDNSSRVEIHAFSDASQAAYGACIYVKSISDSGHTLVRLLTAKSRVSPLKVTTIPRLELCGALLAVTLTKTALAALKLSIDEIFYYTDSTIVLSWLRLESSSLKTFVGNRVASIQEATNINQWRHVAGCENPGDIISRGMNPSDLLNSKLWFNGPSWLSQNQYNEFKDFELKTESLPEIKKINLVNISHNNEVMWIHKFSNYWKLLKVTSYMLRFLNKARKIDIPKNTDLSIAEINQSLNQIIKIVQIQCFENDIVSIKKSKTVLKNSNLKALNPFLCPDGLLRVGGRLRNANIEYDQKFPIILPYKHHFTSLIIKHEHLKNCHAGVQTSLANIRLKFWPIKGAQAVRNELRNCITCFKTNPSSGTPLMGDLPSERISPSRAFLVTGVDFAGPFFVRDGKLRNRKLVKCYVSLFICFSTKAVHLELVGDLSASSFLNCLKRFVSRRGLCNQLVSDNATNFIGANNELNEIRKYLLNNDVKNYLLENRIAWKFIPAKSPHHGGLWESGVKLAKTYLKRTFDTTNLTFEEFTTVLCQIEAAINSRPLYPLSPDPKDLNSLTPGHFLIGGPLKAVPQKDSMDVKAPARYEHLQQLAQQFWKRWSTDYLHNLQQRSKWRFKKPNTTLVGKLVLLKEDNLPPQKWRLARIHELHPGSDGEVRVITVQTTNGLLKRSVNKVCVLPIDSEDN